MCKMIELDTSKTVVTVKPYIVLLTLYTKKSVGQHVNYTIKELVAIFIL
jgi:hypothetical protein